MFKVGDKVRIRKDLTEENTKNYINAMKEFLGKEAKIINILQDDDSHSYELDIDSRSWFWEDEMFEKIEEEKVEDIKFKVKCIDNDNTPLEKDVIYSVMDESPEYYYLEGHPEGGYYKKRFEKVEEKMKKEYHFFEVMKAYSEDVCFNNKNKFKRVSDGLIVSVNNNNELNYSSDFAKINIYNDKFTLVEEPKEVSFLEAMEALDNGKKVKCVLGNQTTYYEKPTLTDIDGCAMMVNELLQGKWYIINE